MLLAWFTIPHTPPGHINSITSKIGLKYFGASLVGFFELLVYGAAKKSLRIVVLATVVGVIGCIITYGAWSMP